MFPGTLIVSEDGKSTLVEIPAGAQLIVQETLWAGADHTRKIEVHWQGQTVTVFAIDLRERGEQIDNGSI